ncbi:site-specific DNA-methyltransferase [Aurantiacibacter odishensis]|uniref:site-specific DNA-methyltransferase n=1 Tax=Aurantiacibacter odishensis TaxID=1155476 RepID=UPI000E73D471|nr:site-specific DNA-methyltransferase [Aurantiacibacter odishensis]
MPVLNWLTRGEDVREADAVPYRLLEQVPELGAGNTDTSNMLIQGDNLEALKALLPFYAGQVKCIYIDPPYNTKSAFEHYDDNLEHSKWLAMIYPRLVLLRELLAEDGSIFISIDDNEAHYLKVLCDEVFGRGNFLNDVSARMKLIAGASGGGEEKKLRKNIEHILVYAKNAFGLGGFERFNDVYESVPLMDEIEAMESAGKSWKYTSVLVSKGEPVEERTVLTGDGEKIRVVRRVGIERTTVNQLSKDGTEISRIYDEYLPSIFSDTNAQTSIRTRIKDEFRALANGEILEATYVPRSGKDKGKEVTHYYIAKSVRRVIWLSDIARLEAGKAVKREKVGSFWEGFPLNNLTKEGGVRFPNGKKPEALVQRILQLATNEGDLVLDSFLGSGTTAAVAHKMGRRYIGVELRDNAVTHAQPRLKRVIEGEMGGISKTIGWKGGGGFRFFRLGPSVFDDQGQIREDIEFETLAAHVWFSERANPWNREERRGTVLGVQADTALALLYNGVLRDRSVDGGNVLTRATLKVIRQDLPEDFAGELLVYGERCVLSEATLKRERITFKQTPYDVKARV